jgi:hypothetical protein
MSATQSAQALVTATTSSMPAPSEALSCPVFVGSGTLLGEDSCVWSKATGQFVSQLSTQTDSVGWRVGGQAELMSG